MTSLKNEIRKQTNQQPLCVTHLLYVSGRGLSSRNRAVEKLFSWSFPAIAIVPVLMGHDRQSRYQISACSVARAWTPSQMALGSNPSRFLVVRSLEEISSPVT